MPTGGTAMGPGKGVDKHKFGMDPNRLKNEGQQKFQFPVGPSSPINDGNPFNKMGMGAAKGQNPNFQKPGRMNPNTNPMMRFNRPTPSPDYVRQFNASQPRMSLRRMRPNGGIVE